ncbi:MAG: zinc-dependent peptidase [Pirellulales bacterium]|nr:zinc-dependent peptidase [Pirellulales bacterium]
MSQPFPREWANVLQRRVRHYRSLPAEQQRRVEHITQVMAAEKEWAGVGDFRVTEDMRVTIAGQAAVMVSGFQEEYFFDRLDTLVIHPGTVQFTAAQASRNPNLPAGLLDGIAWHHGPVVLSWGRVRRELKGHSPGRNVVLHEFAHHLDGLCGDMDGAPPLGDRQRQRRWYAVTEAEYLRLVGAVRRGEATLLDHYGAKNRAEFFAVATECFFELPHELAERHAQLYAALADFYRQDPRRWLPRLTPTLADPATSGQWVNIGYRDRRRDDVARMRAMRAMPTGDALFALGLDHLQMGRAAEALRVFTALVQNDPRDEESLAHRAAAQFQLGRLDEARVDCNAALAIDPDDIKALCVRAELQLDDGQAEAALADADRAVEASPGNVEARLARARIWLTLDRPRKAVADLNEALGREPYAAAAYFERGRAKRALGRHGEAEQDIARAKLLEPDRDWAE